MKARWTTDHSASSYGVPVLVDDEGNAYGPGDLVTTEQAAALLGVTPGRVRHYLADGRLPGQKLGRDWLILVSDLEKIETHQGWPKGRPRKA
jgi:excisionase family DNA binding protein